MSATQDVVPAGAGGDHPPGLAWPATVTRVQAEQWVHRRLPSARDVSITMFHHPMMGIEFEWTRRRRDPIWVNVLVDLVGGRAYAAEPWHDRAFETLESPGDDGVRSPMRRLSDAEAQERALRLADSVLLRRRRLDPAGRLRRHGEAVYFGKPNWWITGQHRGRRMEIVLDALTGGHYVFCA